MRIIKAQQDFVVLRRAGALPAALLDQIEDYFQQLRDELEDEDRSEFRLDRNGYIVVLVAGDNVHDLGKVGLTPERVVRFSLTVITAKNAKGAVTASSNPVPGIGCVQSFCKEETACLL